MKIKQISYDYSDKNIRKNSKSSVKNATPSIIKEKSCYFPKGVRASSFLVAFGKKYFDNNDINYDYFKLGVSKYTGQPIKPDAFQIEAAKHLQNGKSVLVCAPTGTGKTAIAQYIMSKNLKEGKRTFYTTPLKALSNQKLEEFRKIYGKENVGILTGDRKENADAPIVIMTTEVYRNMGFDNYFSKNPTQNVDTVIFDEFHYLGDPSRGISWEEAIMYSPKNVQILALSATIGNHKDLTNWLSSLSGKECVDVFVPASARSIPLKYSYYDATKKDEINDKNISKKDRHQHKFHVKPEKAREEKFKLIVDNYMKLISSLKGSDDLPAILFVYSKSMNRTLVNEAAFVGEDLTNDKEKQEIRRRLDEAKKDKSAENYISGNLNERALLKGYAMHNAGLMPGEKALVESLFADNLIKVVFSTETLSAGINMPARTVVISSPIKVSSDENGSLTKRTLTANEYHQMSGRAGRRNLDVKKGAKVINFCTEKEHFKIFKELVDSDPNPIISRFKPSYSLIASCLEYNDNLDDLIPFAEKSFRYQSSVLGNPDMDLSNVNEKFDNYMSLLINEKAKILDRENFINVSDDGKMRLTQKGKALHYIIGYPQIPIINTIASGKLLKLSPAELVYFAATIVDSMDSRPGEEKYEVDASNEKAEMFLSEALDDSIFLYNSKQPYKENKLKHAHELVNIEALDAAMLYYQHYNDSYNKQILRMQFCDERPTTLCYRYSPRIALFALMNEKDPDNSLDNWEQIDKYIIKAKTKAGKQTEYSGEFFFKTSQTIDLLNQLLEMCNAEEMQKDERFTGLVENLKKAIGLIQKSPIPSYQEVSN